MMKKGMSLIINSSVTSKCTRYLSAVNIFVVTAPVTEANKRGISADVDNSNIRTSKAKMTAAMGVVKIDAIAPAAPQPINKVLCL